MKKSLPKLRFIVWLYVLGRLPFSGSNFFQLAGGSFRKINGLQFISYDGFRLEMREDFEIEVWMPLQEEFSKGWSRLCSVIPYEYAGAATIWGRMAQKASCKPSVVLCNNIACCQFHLKQRDQSRATITTAYKKMVRLDTRLKKNDATKVKNAIRDNYLYITENT